LCFLFLRKVQQKPQTETSWFLYLVLFLLFGPAEFQVSLSKNKTGLNLEYPERAQKTEKSENNYKTSKFLLREVASSNDKQSRIECALWEQTYQRSYSKGLSIHLFLCFTE
jgi:hypothetical protein